MKTYIQGIILGILSILSGLLINGIPFGTSIIEIINIAVLVIGAFALIFLGIFKKKYTAALITSAVYLVILCTLTTIIELKMSGFVIVGVGFVPGLSIALTGLITSINQKGERKIVAGIILNSLGLLISIASGIMGLVASIN